MIIEILIKIADFVITPILAIIGQIFETLQINTILNPIAETIEFLLSSTQALMWLFFDLTTLKFLLKAVIAVESGFLIYRIIMWAIKKIPKFNVQ